MAITELWNSQEMHVTVEGTDATRKFSCTWADAYAGTDGTDILPMIGNYWSPARKDLLCTDLSLTANGRTNVLVTATFSTEKGSIRRKRREDFKESWEESLDIHLEETPVTNYLSYTQPEDGKGSAVTEKTWSEVWSDAGGDEDKIPDLMQFQPRASWSVTCYGSTNRMAQILTHIGKTNERPFLKTYFSEMTNSGILLDDDPELATFGDVGLWMFMGARINRVRTTCWQYDYTFLFNPNGWNTEIVTSDVSVTTNQYTTFDYFVLFKGMQATDEDGEGGFAAQDNATQGGF